MSDRKAAAERFWSRFDIPFEYGTAIKVRRSGLTRGSSGTGRARDTVVHLHVKEAFTDGRLSRGPDTYLCEPDSNVFGQAKEKPLGDGVEQKVTCETCLSRMERWETDPADSWAVTDGGTNMVLYLTTVGCPGCGAETTFAHEGPNVPIDQETPWPDAEFCPACSEPYPEDLGAAMTEVANAERIRPEDLATGGDRGD